MDSMGGVTGGVVSNLERGGGQSKPHGPRLTWSGLGLALVVLAIGLPAAAQDSGFEVNRFHPSPSQRMNYFTVEGGESLPGGAYEFGVMAHVADDPFVATRADDRIFSIIERQWTLDLLAVYSPVQNLEFGLDVPFYLAQTGGEEGAFGGTDALEGGGIGDIRITPKWTFLHGREGDDNGGFDMALLAVVSIPTGDSDAFQSEGFRAEPKIAADFLTDSGFGVGLNVGAIIRENQTFSNVEVGEQLTYGLGLKVPLVAHTLLAIGEITGALTLGADDLGAEENPLEFLLGARLALGDVYITGGAGSGIVEGYGAPDFRAFLGLSYSHGDEGRDDCPDEDEDIDGFEDEDGCPDPDNDQDGILDLDDECPVDAEDIDGFEDEDGCPDPDNDQDGILDLDDECPEDAEDIDEFEDADGCPDPDNDQDGILDVDDLCPNNAEDPDGFEDEDGCPEEGPVIERAAVIEITQQIQFDYDSARIRTESYPILDAVAEILHSNEDITLVRVEGHTSTEGSESHNMDLSIRRANSVVDALVSRGIARSRLNPQGFGESTPLEPDETVPGARELNRRVEFHIVERE